MLELGSLRSMKHSWEPIKPSPFSLTYDSEILFSKILALRELELSVGDFVNSASKRDLPVDSASLELINSNIKDEIVHEKALSLLYEAMPEDCRIPYSEIEQFRKEAERIASIEHPLAVARMLEVGVFFVLLPIMRFLGSTGMKVIANDISRDERVHVMTNTRILKELNIKPSAELDRLRREIVWWFVQETDRLKLPESLSQYGSSKFWLKQSDNLYYYNRTEGLRDTKKTCVLAFFEIDRRNQPIYS